MKPKQTNRRSTAEAFFSWIFPLLSVGFLGLFAFLVYSEQDGQLLTLLAAAFSLIGSRTNDLKSFNLSMQGVSADLQARIETAQSTLAQLQEFAIAWATVSTEQILGAGRFGGTPRETKKRQFDHVRKVLSSLELDGDAILENVAYKYHHFDYAQAVFQAAPTHADKSWNEALSEYAESHRGIGKEANPDELEKLFETHDRLTPEVKQALEDYRHFHEKKSHRHQERF